MQIVVRKAMGVWVFPIVLASALDFAASAAGQTLPSGDVNGDGARNIGDAVYLLSHLFGRGAPPVVCGPCAVADMPPPWKSVRSDGAGTGDINGDGRLNIADPIVLLGYLFANGPEPVSCGTCWACGPRSLPATGELGCFGYTFTYIDCNSPEWPGQDAYYAMGCPLEGRFVDNGDGTVMDTCTNLMWQKETARPEGSEVYEYKTSWQDALKYAEALEFADYDDWRLPNINELSSILVWREPPLNQQVNERTYVPEPFDVPATWPWSNYWSSTFGMNVLLSFGKVGYLDASRCPLGPPDCEGAHIRCVRGGLGPEARLPATGMDFCVEPDGNFGLKVVSCDATSFVGQDAVYQAGCPMEGRFVDNGDGTVTDLCTGLLWMQDPAVPDTSYNPDECDGVFWQDALVYAESLEFAGYNDWRLPNVRELLMLGNWGFWLSDIHDPKLKRTYPFGFGKAELDPDFPYMSDCTPVYWTSSAAAHTFAHRVGHSPLGVGSGLADVWSWKFLIRCVRGPLWIDER